MFANAGIAWPSAPIADAGVNHVGLGSIKNVTGIRKDLTDTKKAKLEIKKFEKEADLPVIQPATFQDLKEYDPNYQALEKHIRAGSR